MKLQDKYTEDLGRVTVEADQEVANAREIDCGFPEWLCQHDEDWTCSS